jgi:NAD(P)-dependent dehydrogenase (short-subunit alcohol dehydrogenase family)
LQSTKIDFMTAPFLVSFSGRNFCGKPVSTPDQVRGRHFPENAVTVGIHGNAESPDKKWSVEMTGEFVGKVVVISGGSRGIGRGIALAFAREGAQTVLASSSEQNLAPAAKAVAAVGPEPLAVAGDLRTLAACERLRERVDERFKRCDVLVNNAGATRAGNFVELPDEAWIDGFALKFLGAVRLTRLFWPLLKASKGSVVNIVGGAGRSPEPEFMIGGSVNAAVANFSKGLSKLGNRDDVNVNVIHPGNTDTERQEQLRQQRAAAMGKTVEELRAEGLSKSGIRRFGKPEDIAALALFLCSERTRHIQGTAIAVDGGATPGVY